jgi:hypothetical protein
MTRVSSSIGADSNAAFSGAGSYHVDQAVFGGPAGWLPGPPRFDLAVEPDL